MNNMLKHIQDRIGAENCRRSCSRDKCMVHLDDINPDRVIANADSKGLSEFFPGKRCDFILFLKESGGTMVIVPLELKSGKAEANDIAEQLQAGARFAEEMIPEPCPFSPVCRPILFHGRSLHPLQRKELNRKKVRFRGYEWTIQTARCGRPGNLANALSLERGQSQGGRQR